METEQGEISSIFIIILVTLFITFIIYFITKSQKSNPPLLLQPLPTSITKTSPKVGINSPIIIIPGLGGTNLSFETGEDFNSNSCQPQKLETLEKLQPTLWINALGLLTQKDCFLNLLKPVYENETLQNLPNLKVFPNEKYPGDPLSSECLSYLSEKNRICFPGTSYSKNFVNFFTNKGYQSGLDLFVLGYDFRLVPYKEHGEEFFNRMKVLIEKTFNNLGKKINLVGHSLGTSLINMFLNKMDKSWKKKYIERFISVSPSYDGAPKALRTCLSGYNFGLPEFLKVGNSDFIKPQRYIAGLISNLPLLPKMYGPTNSKGEGNGEALVLLKNCSCSTACKCSSLFKKSYNLNDYEEGIIGVLRAVAKDTNTPDLLDTVDILIPLAKQKEKYAYTDPKVPVFQIIVQPIPTESSYIYDLENGFNNDPVFTTTVVGDHDIPVYGSRIPELFNWKDVTNKIFPPLNGLDHYNDYADSPVVYEYIFDIIN